MTTMRSPSSKPEYSKLDMLNSSSSSDEVELMLPPQRSFPNANGSCSSEGKHKRKRKTKRFHDNLKFPPASMKQQGCLGSCTCWLSTVVALLVIFAVVMAAVLTSAFRNLTAIQVRLDTYAAYNKQMLHDVPSLQKTAEEFKAELDKLKTEANVNITRLEKELAESKHKNTAAMDKKLVGDAVAKLSEEIMNTVAKLGSRVSVLERSGSKEDNNESANFGRESLRGPFSDAECCLSVSEYSHRLSSAVDNVTLDIAMLREEFLLLRNGGGREGASEYSQTQGGHGNTGDSSMSFDTLAKTVNVETLRNRVDLLEGMVHKLSDSFNVLSTQGLDKTLINATAYGGLEKTFVDTLDRYNSRMMDSNGQSGRSPSMGGEKDSAPGSSTFGGIDADMLASLSQMAGSQFGNMSNFPSMLARVSQMAGSQFGNMSTLLAPGGVLDVIVAVISDKHVQQTYFDVMSSFLQNDRIRSILLEANGMLFRVFKAAFGKVHDADTQACLEEYEKNFQCTQVLFRPTGTSAGSGTPGNSASPHVTIPKLTFSGKTSNDQGNATDKPKQSNVPDANDKEASGTGNKNDHASEDHTDAAIQPSEVILVADGDSTGNPANEINSGILLDEAGQAVLTSSLPDV